MQRCTAVTFTGKPALLMKKLAAPLLPEHSLISKLFSAKKQALHIASLTWSAVAWRQRASRRSRLVAR